MLRFNLWRASLIFSLILWFGIEWTSLSTHYFVPNYQVIPPISMVIARHFSVLLPLFQNKLSLSFGTIWTNLSDDKLRRPTKTITISIQSVGLG